MEEGVGGDGAGDGAEVVDGFAEVLGDEVAADAFGKGGFDPFEGGSGAL